MLSSLKADPSLYFKTLGDVFRMEVIPHSESTVFFVFFLLKASDILSWLFGGTPRCRKHLEKRQRDKREGKKKIREQDMSLTCARRNAVVPWGPIYPRPPTDHEMVRISELMRLDSTSMITTEPLCVRGPIAPHRSGGGRDVRPAPQLPTHCSRLTRPRGSACQSLLLPELWSTWVGRWRWANRRLCWCFLRWEAFGTSPSNLQRGSEWHSGLKIISFTGWWCIL